MSYSKALSSLTLILVQSTACPRQQNCTIITVKSVSWIVPCSGVGWSSIDPGYALELQSRAAEGEFWLDEGEFLSQFNDITVGYPITDEGHLRSIYSGQFYAFKIGLNMVDFQCSIFSKWAISSFNRSFTDTQSPGGRSVGQRALCWWQPEQHPLRQQP